MGSLPMAGWRKIKTKNLFNALLLPSMNSVFAGMQINVEILNHIYLPDLAKRKGWNGTNPKS